jgi:hypothetical protein
VPVGAGWAFELKHDGFHFIARRDGDRVRVFSRHAKDWTDKVPAIVEALLGLPVTSATIDGEGVVVDERGVTPDFDRPRTALAARGGSREAFYTRSTCSNLMARICGRVPGMTDGWPWYGCFGLRISGSPSGTASRLQIS